MGLLSGSPPEENDPRHSIPDEKALTRQKEKVLDSLKYERIPPDQETGQGEVIRYVDKGPLPGAKEADHGSVRRYILLLEARDRAMAAVGRLEATLEVLSMANDLAGKAQSRWHSMMVKELSDFLKEAAEEWWDAAAHTRGLIASACRHRSHEHYRELYKEVAETFSPKDLLRLRESSPFFNDLKKYAAPHPRCFQSIKADRTKDCICFEGGGCTLNMEVKEPLRHTFLFQSMIPGTDGFIFIMLHTENSGYMDLHINTADPAMPATCHPHN